MNPINMNKKTLSAITGCVPPLALLILFAATGWGYFKGKTDASAIISDVKVINGVPKIFLKGREFNVVAAQIYNYPDFTSYGPDWLDGVKKTIDAEKEAGATLILIHLWWSELDKSISRPDNLGDNLDFSYSDKAMDYAHEKGIQVMLLTGMHTFIPQWWAKEQGFNQPSVTAASICMPKGRGEDRTCIPKELCADGKNCCGKDTEELMCCDIARDDATRKSISITPDYKILKCRNINNGLNYSSCSSCETDNFGWKYNNPSIGYDKSRTDYGEYLTAVINRYKNHPALLGWQMQLGFAGEDYYGPNYIAIQGLVNDPYGSDAIRKGRMTDYSKSFKDSFKTWLTKKYKTPAALQSAWKDANINLKNFKIPLNSEFFVDGKDLPFPDDGYLNSFVRLGDLTQKGKDFYKFRKYMKTKDSKYYSNLFKSLDPYHVLYFNAYDNFEEYKDKNINGYFLNNRLNAERNDSYPQALIYGILASKYGQYGLPAWENNYEAAEDQNQLDTMEEAGKALRCFGFGFGYATALPGTETQLPVWSSKNAKQVIRNIIDYTPTEACKCEFINKPYLWHGKTIKQMLGMYSITEYDYCKNPSDQNDGESEAPSAQGKCGDGICDDIEMQSGFCQDDCATTKSSRPPSSATKRNTQAPDQGRCGDGVCAAPETKSKCPQDCK